MDGPRCRISWCLLLWSGALVRLLWLVGVVELTRVGNVMMSRCHHMANSGQHKCRTGFMFLSTYTHTYIYIYMYSLISLSEHKSPLVVSSVTLDRWRLKNVFTLAWVFSHYTECTNWFAYSYVMSWFYFKYMCLLCYVYMYFNYLTVFSTSRYSKLGSLIFYSVYLTSIFILIPLTSLFKLGAFLLCYHSYSSVLRWSHPTISHL